MGQPAAQAIRRTKTDRHGHHEVAPGIGIELAQQIDSQIALAAGDAGFGEKGETRRPHRVAWHDRKSVRRERTQLAARLVEHAELGVEDREPGTPHRLLFLARRQHPHQRKHFGQSALFAANCEHLQAVHAGIEHGVARLPDGMCLVSGLFRLIEPAEGQREQG